MLAGLAQSGQLLSRSTVEVAYERRAAADTSEGGRRMAVLHQKFAGDSKMSYRARFGTQFHPKRSYGARELVQGLVEVAWAPGEGHPDWRRTAHKAHDGDDVGCLGCEKMKRSSLPHLDVNLR
jgi:hypothetical protein